MSTLYKLNIDLTESFPHLARAPIVEAVIEIRARAEGSWEEEAVMHQLKTKLPDYPVAASQSEFRQEIRFDPGQPPEATTHDLGWKGLRFQSADNRHIAQFKRDGFVFSRLPPYENWEQLYSEAMRLWLLHVGLSRPREAQRIGLRFIDRIVLPPQDMLFESYIHSTPPLIQGVDLLLAGFFHQETLGVPGHPYAVNVARTIQPEPSTQGMAIILDIDVFTTQVCELKQEILKQRFLEMRWLKNKVFFGSITPKALEMFQ
jgi:uncharacterized protein (TIGR04255 family)